MYAPCFTEKKLLNLPLKKREEKHHGNDDGQIAICRR
jgi:hypothetical protein